MPSIAARHRRPARRIHHPFEGRIDTRRRRRLKEVAAGLPRTAGVYFFHGYKDRLIYIGKASCLRERVGSYFADTSVRRSTKLRRLLAEVQRVEYRQCGSELEAMLLERLLIAERRPLLNREHNRFDIYPYLLLTAEEFPRLLVTRAEPVPGLVMEEARDHDWGAPLENAPYPGDIPGLYLGPFTTPSVAYWTFHALRCLFPLRTCEGKLHPNPAGKACIYLEIRRCAGPCVGAVSREAYTAMCAELVSLLHTGASPRLKQLRERMQELAEAWRFEEAAELREQLAAIEAMTLRLRRLQRMREENNVVILRPSLQPGFFNAFLVRGGVVRRHLHSDDWDALVVEAQATFATTLPGDDFTTKTEMDEMLLLDRWLRSHGKEPCCAWVRQGPARKRSGQQIAHGAVKQLQKWARDVQLIGS